MSDAVTMVEVWRGGFAESAHRGHAVICDATGAIRAAWGDPEAVILPRSSCKMLQALPLVESGARLSSEQLALACASHQGAEMHVGRVARWLEEMGLGEPDLRCGSQIPDDKAERGRLREGFEPPCQLHNNCSGKHAGFLMLNRHLNGGPEYVEPEHVVQRAVRAAFEEMTGAPAPATASTAVPRRISPPRCMGSPGRWRAWPTLRAWGAPARRRRGGWWRRCWRIRCWSRARGGPVRN